MAAVEVTQTIMASDTLSAMTVLLQSLQGTLLGGWSVLGQHILMRLSQMLPRPPLTGGPMWGPFRGRATYR